MQRVILKNIRKYVSCLALVLSFLGCGQQNESSDVKSVNIPQSSVKSQGTIGFCWAYSTTGFLESLILKKHHMVVNLSEEALGFYRMANELLWMSNNFPAEELASVAAIEQKTFEGLEGWDLVFTKRYHPDFASPGSLELIMQKGVVPESVWSFKFETEKQRSVFFANVFEGFSELMKKRGQGNISMKMIEDLLASPGAFGSVPPNHFKMSLPEGGVKNYTATDFVSSFIGFDPRDYKYLEIDEKIGYDELISAIKKTLALGIDVPLGFPVFDSQVTYATGTITGKGMQIEPGESDGGHAVLVTDFVNIGGRPGQIASKTLQKELERSTGDLDFLVVKNSWGTKSVNPLVSMPGYFTLDQSYLRASSSKTQTMSIVVPRKIALEATWGL